MSTPDGGLVCLIKENDLYGLAGVVGGTGPLENMIGREVMGMPLCTRQRVKVNQFISLFTYELMTDIEREEERRTIVCRRSRPSPKRTKPKDTETPPIGLEPRPNPAKKAPFCFRRPYMADGGG